MLKGGSCIDMEEEEVRWFKKKEPENNVETRLALLYKLFDMYEIKNMPALDGTIGGPKQQFEGKMGNLFRLACADFNMPLYAFALASCIKVSEEQFSAHIVYYGCSAEQGEQWITGLAHQMTKLSKGEAEGIAF